MPQLSPYLSFDGQCAEAMRFYERTLGGTLAPMMKHSDAPMAPPAPQGAGDRIMHSRLELPGGPVLMAGDSPAGMGHRPMSGIRIALTYATAEEAKAAYAGLADGATVEMALQTTFWAEAFGMLSDRFGTPWIINGGMKG